MPSGQLPAVQVPDGIFIAADNVTPLDTLVSSVPANPLIHFAEIPPPCFPVLDTLFGQPPEGGIDLLGGSTPLPTDFHLG